LKKADGLKEEMAKADDRGGKEKTEM